MVEYIIIVAQARGPSGNDGRRGDTPMAVSSGGHSIQLRAMNGEVVSVDQHEGN